MAKNNVVIAGGGTGGHIYPGLALAEKLKSRNPDIQVHFVGARGGLEENIIPRHGYPLHLFPIDRLHSSVGLLKRVKTLCLLPICFLQAIFLYIKLRPRWVLGVGGFASAPFVFVASLLGGRTSILEPNAFPGMANRHLSKWVRFCFLVFKETEKYFPKDKVHTVGLPIRFEKRPSKKDYSSGEAMKLLIFGGSQGARAINQVIGDWVEKYPEVGEKFEIIHQVGQRDHSYWQERYGDKHQSFLTYQAYIHDMPEKLDWADMVICRAGIGTVAEVAMCRKPAIFVPLPTAADNHQQKNAETLVNKGAGMMILQPNFNADSLQERMQSLLSGRHKLAEMAKELENIDYSQAPEKILSCLMEG